MKQLALPHAASSPAVANRYDCEEASPKSLRDQLKAAVEAENWDLAQQLTAELAKRDRQAGWVIAFFPRPHGKHRSVPVV